MLRREGGREEVRKPLVARINHKCQDLTLRPDWKNLIAYSDWLSLTDRRVVIGCLLIDLVMLIDTYRTMIVRFAVRATRGFLLPLLSLSVS